MTQWWPLGRSVPNALRDMCGPLKGSCLMENIQLVTSYWVLLFWWLVPLAIKILLVFRHMGLVCYSARTFFKHQRSFLFPAVIYHWESYQTDLLNKVKDLKDVVWAGDGRYDSMGHSAKYGAYTLLCTTIMKIVHFELVQVWRFYKWSPSI